MQRWSAPCASTFFILSVRWDFSVSVCTKL